MTATPRISVIIPAHNEENYLDRPLKSLASQSFRDFETIVVADACTDQTIAVAKQCPCRIIEVQNRSIGANRNAGAKEAKSQILVFLDADVRVSDRYLEQVAAAAAKGHTCGRPRYFFDSRDLIIRNYMMLHNLFRLPYYPHSYFVTKEVFTASGGYKEAMNNWEDLEFSDRVSKLGKTCMIEAKAWNSDRRFSRSGFWHHFLYEIYSPLRYLISYKLLRIKTTTDYPVVR